MELADGELVAFLDADDLWLPRNALRYLVIRVLLGLSMLMRPVALLAPLVFAAFLLFGALRRRFAVAAVSHYAARNVQNSLCRFA